jgi:tricorn protease
VVVGLCVPLIDGGDIECPSFAFYETDGTWGVEGHGVDPDIEVIDDPALMQDGADPQLDRAIAQMLEDLRTTPYVAPKHPPYPDRRGMGLDPKDQ